MAWTWRTVVERRCCRGLSHDSKGEGCFVDASDGVVGFEEDQPVAMVFDGDVLVLQPAAGREAPGTRAIHRSSIVANHDGDEGLERGKKSGRVAK